MEKLFTISYDKIGSILFEIRKAIHEVHKQRLSEDGIRILMPEFTIQAINIYNQKNLGTGSCFEYEEGKTTCYGVKILPNYESFIVVYHIDMPLQRNTCYQVINLK